MPNASGYLATNYGVPTSANYGVATSTNYGVPASMNYSAPNQSNVYDYGVVNPIPNSYAPISPAPGTVPSIPAMNSASASTPVYGPNVAPNTNVTVNTYVAPSANIPVTPTSKPEPAKPKPTKFDLMSDLDNIAIPAPTLQPIKTTEKAQDSKPAAKSDSKPGSIAPQKPEMR